MSRDYYFNIVKKSILIIIKIFFTKTKSIIHLIYYKGFNERRYKYTYTQLKISFHNF